MEYGVRVGSYDKYYGYNGMVHGKRGLKWAVRDGVSRSMIAKGLNFIIKRVEGGNCASLKEAATQYLCSHWEGAFTESRVDSVVKRLVRKASAAIKEMDKPPPNDDEAIWGVVMLMEKEGLTSVDAATRRYLDTNPSALSGRTRTEAVNTIRRGTKVFYRRRIETKKYIKFYERRRAESLTNLVSWRRKK